MSEPERMTPKPPERLPGQTVTGIPGFDVGYPGASTTGPHVIHVPYPGAFDNVPDEGLPPSMQKASTKGRVLAWLRARWGERWTKVGLVVLVLVAAGVRPGDIETVLALLGVDPATAAVIVGAIIAIVKRTR